MNRKELREEIIRVIDESGLYDGFDDLKKANWETLGYWQAEAYRLSESEDDPDELRMGPHPYEYIDETLRPEMVKLVQRIDRRASREYDLDEMGSEELGELIDSLLE